MNLHAFLQNLTNEQLQDLQKNPYQAFKAANIAMPETYSEELDSEPDDDPLPVAISQPPMLQLGDQVVRAALKEARSPKKRSLERGDLKKRRVISASVHPWGTRVTFSHGLVESMKGWDGAIGAMGPAIATGLAASAVFSGKVAAAVGAGFAVVAVTKYIQMKKVDRGDGIYWPVSWPQWGGIGLGGGLSLGAGLPAAVATLVHPWRNKGKHLRHLVKDGVDLGPV